MATLYNLTTEYQRLLDTALESEEISNETFENIKKLDEEIDSKIENIVNVIKELEGKIFILNQEIERLSERSTRYYKNSIALKKYIKDTMEFSGKTKVETPSMTIGIRKSESIEIGKDFIEEVKEKSLYKLMRIIPEKIEPDKVAIKEYIKHGNKLEHAKIVEKTNLSIR